MMYNFRIFRTSVSVFFNFVFCGFSFVLSGFPYGPVDMRPRRILICKLVVAAYTPSGGRALPIIRSPADCLVAELLVGALVPKMDYVHPEDPPKQLLRGHSPRVRREPVRVSKCPC